MRIYVLDDEPIALRGTIKTIQEVLPDAEITGFSRAQKALRHIADTNERPDVVFCDIEMPGISGLDFAVRLKKACPEARIIFVTAYSQYALEAFRLHVHGYILKPITADRVKEELAYCLADRETLQTDGRPQTGEIRQTGENPQTGDTSRTRGARQAGKTPQAGPEKLRVHCFGYFEVFWKNEPLMFGRRPVPGSCRIFDRDGEQCSAVLSRLCL